MGKGNQFNRLSENFSRREFECHCGCGKDTIDVKTIEVLQKVRDHFQAPVTVHSGFRCVQHNMAVGGAPNSQHLVGRAADIVVDGVPVEAVHAYLKKQLGENGGLGLYPRFVHVDTRSDGPARW